jgi:hypothetical protein
MIISHTEKQGSMNNRELYKQKYEAQMHEWSAKLDLMKAQSEKLTAEAKLEMKPHLDSVHEKLGAAQARFQDAAMATDDRWHELTSSIDESWKDFKASVEGAYDALKRHDKG